MWIFHKKKNIKFIPCINIKEIALAVSQIICEAVKNNSRAILGFSAGVTVKELYNQLSADAKKQKINFTEVITFNTDEYIDIDKRYKKYSKTNFMRDHLFSRININIENTHFPSIDNWKSYDKQIQKKGGIDLLILTVGADGYIAFNEPGTRLSSTTHLGDLENNTRTHLMEYFDEKINVPYKVITMGIKSLLRAKKIIVIATGPAKAAPVSKLFEKKYSSLWPVTSLIFHNDVTLFADIDACRLMQK